MEGSKFIEKIREDHLLPSVKARELPEVRKILALIEPEKILRIVCGKFGVEREEVLKKGPGGAGRAFLMKILYGYKGMNQREIGEFLWINNSAVSMSRKRLQSLLQRDNNPRKRIEEIKMI